MTALARVPAWQHSRRQAYPPVLSAATPHEGVNARLESSTPRNTRTVCGRMRHAFRGMRVNQ